MSCHLFVVIIQFGDNMYENNSEILTESAKYAVQKLGEKYGLSCETIGTQSHNPLRDIIMGKLPGWTRFRKTYENGARVRISAEEVLKMVGPEIYELSEKEKSVPFCDLDQSASAA